MHMLARTRCLLGNHCTQGGLLLVMEDSPGKIPMRGCDLPLWRDDTLHLDFDLFGASEE